MFAIIKNLLGRRNSNGIKSSGSLMTSTLSANGREFHPRAVSPNVTPCPVTAPVETHAETTPPGELPALAPGESISLPLAKIVARFPQELAGTVLQPPADDLHIALPVAEILEQLSRGIVRVPFGIIRHAAPQGCFASTANFDAIGVTLPLEEIIARLSPAQLPRRATQKRINVPDSVAAPFNGGAAAPANRANTDFVARPVEAPVPAAPAPVAPVTVPAQTPVAVAPPEQVSVASPAYTFSSLPVAAPVVPTPVRVEPPAAAATPVAPAPQPAPATSARSETSFFRANCLVLPLNRLVNNWPQGVVHEIAQQGLQSAQVELPASQIEAGLKLGKLQFSWKQLRNWTPSIPKPHTESPNDAITLELPLRIIAPLFLSARPSAQRNRLQVGEGIPDLFGPTSLSANVSTFPRHSTTEGSTATAAATSPAAPGLDPSFNSPLAVAARSLPKLDVPALPTQPAAPIAMPAGAPTGTNTSFLSRTTIDAIFEEPGKTAWTPTEIVRKTSRLRGIAGVAMFTQDGLMVAEQYSALAGVDTYCALVTQMYNRVFSHAMELRLGGPTRMSFLAEGVTYETFKCGRVYLSVISKPGEKLPAAELTIISDHLTSQSR